MPCDLFKHLIGFQQKFTPKGKRWAADWHCQSIFEASFFVATDLLKMIFFRGWLQFKHTIWWSIERELWCVYDHNKFNDLDQSILHSQTQYTLFWLAITRPFQSSFLFGRNENDSPINIDRAHLII